MDYGCIAYDSASESQLHRLELIQNNAMRIACGAFPGTPIDAMQVECGLPPLNLHRLRHQINYSITVKATPKHISSTILEDHWTIHYGSYTHDSDPIFNKVKDFFEVNSLTKTACPQLGDTHPWLYKPVNIDIGLTYEVKKQDSPFILLALAKEKINSYSNCIQAYTDASKQQNGKAGIGFYIPQYNINISERITDNVSIFAGELTAMKRAIETFNSLASSKTIQADTPLVIFSDSLSSIQSIAVNKPSSRPNLLQNIKQLITFTTNPITIVWVPSHIGVLGNEQADKLAVSATTKNTVDLSINLEIDEAKCLVEQYITAKWQTRWDLSTSYYRNIVPTITTAIKYYNKSRHKEVAITRLRLGKCKLNHYLHTINRHPDGLCQICKVPETIEHYLLKCRNKLTVDILGKCTELNIQPTLQNILNNQEILNCVYKNLDRSL
jgi:ribonuclease HI